MAAGVTVGRTHGLVLTILLGLITRGRLSTWLHLLDSALDVY